MIDPEKIKLALKLRREHEDLVKNRANLGLEAVAKVGAAAGAWLDAENLLTHEEFLDYMDRWNAGEDPR